MCLIFLEYKLIGFDHKYMPLFIFWIENQVFAIIRLGISCKYMLGLIFRIGKLISIITGYRYMLGSIF